MGNILNTETKQADLQGQQQSQNGVNNSFTSQGYKF